MRRLKEMTDQFVNGIEFEEVVQHVGCGFITAKHRARPGVKLIRPKEPMWRKGPPEEFLNDMAMALWVSGDDAYETGDFSDHPETVGELRANKTRKAKSWAPRDALLTCLREIDKGWPVSQLVIAYRVDQADTTLSEYGCYVATPDFQQTVGLLHITLNDLLMDKRL